jgi:hypothetical protein
VQFTGKYLRPRRTEVLFDRICARNGIDHLLTKIRSPTTTGKIERWHQSIQTELLDDHGPFDDLQAAQAAVDECVHHYNHVRPHQARGMDTPALHFQPTPHQERDALALWTPPELTGLPDHEPDPDTDLEPTIDPATLTGDEVPAVLIDPALAAVEIDRVVPASGNLGVCGQQFWLGTGQAGRLVTLWIDTSTVHLALDGIHLKTLPSRMTTTHLTRLRAQGARPAAPRLTAGPVQVHRTVNAPATSRSPGSTSTSAPSTPAAGSSCASTPIWPTSSSTARSPAQPH